jgi:hypothetical protein
VASTGSSSPAVASSALSSASRSDPFGSEAKSASDSTRECKQLLKTMILGVKTVVWSVSNSRMQVRIGVGNTGRGGEAVSMPHGEGT